MFDSAYHRLRRIWVYTPPGYTAHPAAPYPLVVAFDGDEYRDTMPLPQMLDTLLATHKAPAFIAVLIDDSASSVRIADLGNSARMVRFLGQQLIPWMRARWPVTTDPHRVIITGSSAGGLASAYVAFERPDLFGNVWSQSGAFWRGAEASNGAPYEWLTAQVGAAPRKAVRFVLDVGALEDHATLGGAGPNFLAAHRRFTNALVAKGYDVTATEVPGGNHAPQWWRVRLAFGLATIAAEWMTPDATTGYLDRLLRGDSAALLAGFSGDAAIDDPIGGRVRGRSELDRFVAERHAWLTARSARLEILRTTVDARHSVVEALLHLRLPDTAVDLPIAVVGDKTDGNRVTAIRVYHSHWPLEGKHEIRHPLLPRDSTIVLRDIVAEYQRALAAGDAVAALNTFEPDGYFREPSGGIYVHRGPEALRGFLSAILAGGGIQLEHCSVTDDGVVAAIEFNAVQFGARRLEPQAGLAIYERGAMGHLAAARIYDDVNVEALAPATVR
ncbi:MAG TPA: alpha/beta hydrolase-fold protein [Gemmatimonadales bacterium]|nr:alpha/beta hydrolase-fold protein [Gemmatimonadales bacterium]